MSVKVKTTRTYISDRGDEFEISQMTNTHLINTIHHLDEQMATLGKIFHEEEWLSKVAKENIAARNAQVRATRQFLVEELASRDPNEDHSNPHWHD